MHSPDHFMPASFDQLMEDEIKRATDRDYRPTVAEGMSLEDYQELCRTLGWPNEKQVADLLELIRRAEAKAFDVAARHPEFGLQLIPVVLPHEHGFPVYDVDRVEAYGHLDYYIAGANYFTTGRTGIPAYLQTILPVEVLQNRVKFPLNPSPENQEAFFRDVAISIKNLQALLKLNGSWH